jgi:hypothetical protein
LRRLLFLILFFSLLPASDFAEGSARPGIALNIPCHIQLISLSDLFHGFDEIFEVIFFHLKTLYIQYSVPSWIYGLIRFHHLELSKTPPELTMLLLFCDRLIDAPTAISTRSLVSDRRFTTLGWSNNGQGRNSGILNIF